ncbi:hypothetical protein BP6252_00582 [Coleophoma cylindrospora]|uniref:Uncharacterized protein n=1 Tax=Coleophoma cylindrospora TaxID=1849047 RepID=A0A3D8SQF6_9HELO|nr:hypothetical protein BP6252_00582 [Coleophoma cylindrospora]
MEQDSSAFNAPPNQDRSPQRPVPPGHKRSLSGSIWRLPFLRPPIDERAKSKEMDPAPPSPEFVPGEDRISTIAPTSPKKPGRAMAVAIQQQKTRRRKGSLRKAALLGRGAQREKRESKMSALDAAAPQDAFGGDATFSATSPDNVPQSNTFALGIDTTPRPSMDGYASRDNNTLLSPIKTLPMGHEDHIAPPTASTSPTLTYTSTTDDEDILSIAKHIPPALRNPTSGLPGPDSYFPAGSGSLTRRRSSQKAKSPLSMAGLAASPLPPMPDEWDYSETEWWGWVVLIVTWVVFVTGMGSCLGVWSWAWDVGETPKAPPELEDDPTLPIVGYYPALIILTSVMAWVWVVAAWVGMKYFRHAKISGD